MRRCLNGPDPEAELSEFAGSEEEATLGADVEALSPLSKGFATTRGGGVGVAKCELMQSWICPSLAVSSPLGPFGGSSLPQTGHSSSSAICRLGAGGGNAGRGALISSIDR